MHEVFDRIYNHSNPLISAINELSENLSSEISKFLISSRSSACTNSSY
ncbi:hypothetical protein Patl1_33397 [Pistacia atlantica]|uniref:Uncharacterized protein n=1 Tax=Pistacia atlantica TaxID=434234 RepID=A0ACC0ZS43_9ROSI|nr:hypothetical protein Patl1_33397 [Pistacia atlantica]